MYHRRHVIRGILSTSAIAVVSVAGAPSRASEYAGPIVAAAASMRFALSEAAELFTRETGMSLRLNFGSSGNLSRQIRQGAPYQLFLSADEDYALAIAREGHTLGPGALYASGQLVVFAPKGSPVGIDGQLSGVRTALERGDLRAKAV
ncbi:MAG: molybdate ABC transporter substrate-binding protein [Alphaproteobacteria bacterium]